MPENLKFKIQNSKLPILVGPTGIGKSEMAFGLALRLDAEVLSADAFQVYKGLPIGTAQPSLGWQKRVKHHLIGVLDPGEPWNAVLFARKASVILREGLAAKKKFVVVGGAGFYLRALVEGPPAGPGSDPKVREKVALLEPQEAMAWLQTHDPDAAQRLHSNDVMRLRRAVEKTLTPLPEVKTYEPLGRKEVRFIGLERSRENLDRILRTRTDSMWKNGLLTETQGLLDSNLSKEHPVWGAIGYAEAASYLRKEMTEKEAVERTFRRTRQYAKRQWTWFRHQHEVDWMNLDDFKTTEAAVEELLVRFNRQS